jgi:exosome complex RNA-binding protein Rrp42 (RNase PH superfamily)
MYGDIDIYILSKISIMHLVSVINAFTLHDSVVKEMQCLQIRIYTTWDEQHSITGI